MDKNMMEMDAMRSSLHVEVPFTILFKEWKVESTKDAIISCILLLFLSFLHECLKHIRTLLNAMISRIVEQHQKQTRIVRSRQDSECKCVQFKEAKLLTNLPTFKIFNVFTKKRSSRCTLHVASCLLYGVEMFMSLSLMLTAMSFHIGVILSIVVGGMLGKVVLSWPSKLLRAKEEESTCH